MTPYLRTHSPEPNVVMFVMPFGEKDGFDFDYQYTDVWGPAVKAEGFLPERVDEIFGSAALEEHIYRSIQRAEFIVVDFSKRSPNVAYEFAMARMLGKRIVVLTQSSDDIPSDVRGQNRYVLYGADHRSTQAAIKGLVAQLEALRGEPAEEQMLVPMPNYSTARVPGTVIAVAKDFATIKTVDGALCVLSNVDVDYSRVIPDMTRRLKVGDPVSGGFTVEQGSSHTKYTLLKGENPWPRIARLGAGEKITGQITNVREGLGVFVRVNGPVSGLIPQSQLGGRTYAVGDTVEAIVTRVDVEQRRVGLAPSGPVRLVDQTRAGRTFELPTVGHTAVGVVKRISPSEDGQRGGYILVEIPGFPRTAMLHLKNMTAELAADLAAGEIEVDEELDVEVIRVDAATGRVNLREVPEMDADGEAVTAA